MKFKVISPLNHDGKQYSPGDTVEMDEKTAQPLVDGGVLEKGQAAPAPGPFDGMTAEQLKEEAAKRELAIPSGTNKPGIIELLVKFDAEHKE